MLGRLRVVLPLTRERLAGHGAQQQDGEEQRERVVAREPPHGFATPIVIAYARPTRMIRM